MALLCVYIKLRRVTANNSPEKRFVVHGKQQEPPALPSKANCKGWTNKHIQTTSSCPHSLQGWTHSWLEKTFVYIYFIYIYTVYTITSHILNINIYIYIHSPMIYIYILYIIRNRHDFTWKKIPWASHWQHHLPQLSSIAVNVLGGDLLSWMCPGPWATGIGKHQDTCARSITTCACNRVDQLNSHEISI